MYPATSADAGERTLRAPRANPVFRTDERHIRSENTVMEKGNNGLGLFFVQDRNSATTVAHLSCRRRQKLPAHAAPSAEMHALSAANPDAPQSSRA
jgi:hypothetical protein